MKDKVKLWLLQRGAWITVGTGLATLPLDIFGCYKGRFFAVEVKAQGKEPTKKQALTMRFICETGGGRCFWGSDVAALIREIREWMDSLDLLA